MARLARKEMIDPSEVQVLHAVSRCVRRAFLCGDDPVSGESYEHQRQWIRDRLEFLASVFGIDCLTYAVMSNISTSSSAQGPIIARRANREDRCTGHFWEGRYKCQLNPRS